MQIQINMDHNIDGREALADQVRGVVQTALNRVSDHITRVEVHLSDGNGEKRGENDKRCVMEAAWKAASRSRLLSSLQPSTKPSTGLPIS